jgi:hypothetical protein
MAKEKGKEVLVNGTAKDLLADYCGERFETDAAIFQQILYERCGEIINNADNVQERKQKLINRLEKYICLSPKVTRDYLNLLGLILRGIQVITILIALSLIVVKL